MPLKLADGGEGGENRIDPSSEPNPEFIKVPSDTSFVFLLKVHIYEEKWITFAYDL